MTYTKAFIITGIVLIFHAIGLIFGLYSLFSWYDIPLHFGGGFAMGTIGIAVWKDGVHEIRFKGRFAKHLRWWIVPIFVLGFVAIISISWEWHEYLLDILFTAVTRQVGLSDTMADLFFDSIGGLTSVILFYHGYGKSKSF